MAVLRLPATYARSGYSSYTGTTSSGYLAIGLFQSSAFPYPFVNGMFYRGCIGFDFSSLAGATVSKAELFVRGSDTMGSGTSQWTMQLSDTNKWSHTTLASVTANGSDKGSRWFSRTITDSAFLGAISDIGGIGYIHVVQSTAFKLWQGLTDSSTSWAYLEITYTTPSPTPDPPKENTVFITKFSAERCAYNPDTGEYEPSPSGTNVRFSLTASLKTDGDYSGNTLSTELPPKIVIRQAGSSSTSEVTGFWTSGTSCSITNRYITGTFTPDSTWYFELSVTDQYQSISVQTQVGSIHPIMHIPNNKSGVSFGGYSTASSASQKFECYYPAYFYGGIRSGLTTGRVNNTSVNANSYADVSVSFGTTFASVPAVIVTPETGSTAVNTGSVSFGILTGSITTTGFKIRIFNNTSNSRGYAFRWLAFEE